MTLYEGGRNVIYIYAYICTCICCVLSQHKCLHYYVAWCRVQLYSKYTRCLPHGTRRHKSALNVHIISSSCILSSLTRLAITSVLNVAVRVEMLSDFLHFHRFVHLSLLHNTREWSVH